MIRSCFHRLLLAALAVLLIVPVSSAQRLSRSTVKNHGADALAGFIQKEIGEAEAAPFKVRQLVEELDDTIRIDVNSRNDRISIFVDERWNPTGDQTTIFPDGTEYKSKLEGTFLQARYIRRTRRGRKARARRKGRKKAKIWRKDSGFVAVSILPNPEEPGKYEYSFDLPDKRHNLTIVGQLDLSSDEQNQKARVTRVSTAKLFEQAGCGSEAHQDLDFEAHLAQHMPQALEVSNQEVSANTTTAVMEVGTVADSLYYARYGEQSLARIASIFNGFAAWFRSANLDGRADLVFDLKVHQNYPAGSDPLTTSTDAAETLYSLRDLNPWRFSSAVDIVHLFTGKNLNGGTIGIAYVGTVCNSIYKVGLSEDYAYQYGASYNWARIVLTAHEIGHNLASYHDDSSSPTIMAPSVRDTSTWSAYTKGVFDNSINNRFTCLYQSDTPQNNPYDVSGTVTDNQGIAVSGARVTLTIRGVQHVTYTDINGNYSFSDVIGPDSYTLSISKSGYTFSNTTGYLASNLTNLNRTGIRNLYYVELNVIDSDGNPVSGVNYDAQMGDNRTQSVTNSTGRIQLSIRHGESYSIEISQSTCFFQKSTREGQALGPHKRLAICHQA